MTNGTGGSSDRRQIKSVQTAAEIIAAIKARRGATLTELEDDVSLTKPTICTYLTTLRNLGVVRKQGEDVYQLGYRFIPVSEYVKHEMELYWVGREEVDALADRTGDYVHLVGEFQGRQVVIYEAMGEHAIAREYHLRMREKPQELYDSAAGKAILAFLPEERREQLISGMRFEPRTDRTITDAETLRENLSAVRERGYAVNDEEKIRGMRSVGAPVHDQTGAVIGAVSVTALTSRLTGDRFTDEVPKMVMDAVNLIELKLETEE